MKTWPLRAMVKYCLANEPREPIFQQAHSPGFRVRTHASVHEGLLAPDELAASAIAELQGAVSDLNTILELLSTEEAT